MATPVTMPVLGLTMEEGTVAEWLKAEGDAVAKDEPLLTVEMDKGTVEVPSPAAGILRRILVQPGTTVPIKTLIAEIGDTAEVTLPLATPPSASPAGRAGDLPASVTAAAEVAPPVAREAPAVASGRRLFASPRARMRARAVGVDLATLLGSGPNGRIVEADVFAAGATDSRVLATPLARRLAQEHGVAIGDIEGSGPGGRITQDDVLLAAERRAPADRRGADRRAAADRRVADDRRISADRPASDDRRAPGDRRGADDRRAPAAEPAGAAEPATAAVTPFSRLRKITAERMAASTQATARVTLFLDADFSEAARFRSQLQPEFARLGTAKLPWDALIAKAAALALVDHPAVGAQWVDGEGLRQLAAVNIGVAVALEPEGLVVPVLKGADSRSLRDLAGELVELADKARAGRLSPLEMQAGAFTITNLGAYRVDGFTPIINPPETAILGVGRIADKPVVIDGKIEARTMCTLSLSFDHRVVDGAPGAAFLARLAELLERPYALLGI